MENKRNGQTLVSQFEFSGSRREEILRVFQEASSYANETCEEMLPQDATKFWDTLFLNRLKKSMFGQLKLLWGTMKTSDNKSLQEKHQLHVTVFFALPMPHCHPNREYDMPAMEVQFILGFNGTNWQYKQSIIKRMLVSRSLWQETLWGSATQVRDGKVTRMIGNPSMIARAYEREQ